MAAHPTVMDSWPAFWLRARGLRVEACPVVGALADGPYTHDLMRAKVI
jgi:hypothetical protein